MKMLLVLLLVSSSALATPCLTPGVQLNTFSLTMDGNVAHFSGALAVGGTNDCTVSWSWGITTDFDFGDGQTLQNVTIVQDHTYAPGSFVATETRYITVNYLSPNFVTCNSRDQSDCTPYPHSYTDTTTHLFEITSHAPEPATYAMLLAGLGLLGLRRKYGRRMGENGSRWRCRV